MTKMKITITGKRSEGKSMLARNIHKLLQKYTPYIITLTELPNESIQFKSKLKVKKMKYLQPKRVKIEVVNEEDED